MNAQIEMTFRTWGGKRRGAGRPTERRRATEPHGTRERFDRVTPFHVTLRITGEITTLRTPDAYHAIRLAMKTVHARSDFGVVHASLQDDHVHQVVEAANDVALAK